MFKKIVLGILIVIGLLSTIFVLAVFTDVINDPEEPLIEQHDVLSSALRKEILDSCIQDTPEMTPYCNCTVKYLEDTYTGTEIETMYNEQDEANKAILDAVEECKVLIPRSMVNDKLDEDTAPNVPKTTPTTGFTAPVLLPWSGKTMYCKPAYLDFATQAVNNINSKIESDINDFNECLESCSVKHKSNLDKCEDYTGEFLEECIEIASDGSKVCADNCKKYTLEPANERRESLILNISTSLSGKCSQTLQE